MRDDRFDNLWMIGYRKYSEFSEAIGKASIGTQIIIDRKIVGARSKKHCYVDPATYKKVIGKYPPGFDARYDWLEKENKATSKQDSSKHNQTSVKCPKCKSLMNPAKEPSYKFICSRCLYKY